jgi:predicted  nucleic acid-binding Zn-ribbon protein
MTPDYTRCHECKSMGFVYLDGDISMCPECGGDRYLPVTKCDTVDSV